MSEITIREAISVGLREILDKDDRVFLMGEDIGKYGGAYAVTKGFLEEYGKDRVRDTPISESVIVGSAIGAAMAGLRPVIEIMTINFSLLAMDQIVNHAAKLRYMSNGQLSIPIVVRMVTGSGGQLGATHSQNFEGWYASVPGLKVVVPSTPYETLGLFRSSLEDNNPVIFVEHALLYGTKGEVADDFYLVPLGKASVKRHGSDLTIVAYSKSVHTALTAAEILACKGVQTEVIDLCTLRPLDMDTIVKSVNKTGRVIVVEETWRTGGFGAELASRIQEEAFTSLDAPVGRVCGLEVPMPYSRILEAEVIPDANRIIRSVQELFGL